MQRPDIHGDPLAPEALGLLASLPVGGRRLDPPSLVRAMGAFIGAAVGDALGAPFEFGPPGQYTARFPSRVLGSTGEMIGGGSFNWEPGEFTDDTQMALVLAESLLDRRGFDPEHLFMGWKRWAQGAADVGTTIATSLRADDWRLAAAKAHQVIGRSAGNGALMRAFPLGILAAGLSDKLAEGRVVLLSRAQAALTHADPAAGWGAVIAVEMIRRLIHGEQLEPALDAAMALLPPEQQTTFTRWLAVDWNNPPADAPGNGSVWGCLAQALWSVRQHQNFERALQSAIDLGKDTDTVACVAGALAGAREGIAAIPCRWTTYLHGTVTTGQDRRRYDNAALQNLTRCLLGLNAPAHPPEEDAAGPTEVAPGLLAASLPGAIHHLNADPPNTAVLSLCRTLGALDSVPIRREVFLIDKDRGRNPRLDLVVRDAVDTIDAWLGEGRTVLVHCHGGRSRTGLILLAWAMRRHGWDLPKAQAWLRRTWPRYDDWNPDFNRYLSALA